MANNNISVNILIVFIIISIIILLFLFRKDCQKECEYKELMERKAQIKEINTLNGVEKYDKFAQELFEDLDKYKIDQVDQDKIENLVKDILIERELQTKIKENNTKQIVKSGLNGVIRGVVMGILYEGTIVGAGWGGLSLGVINILMDSLNKGINPE